MELEGNHREAKELALIPATCVEEKNTSEELRNIVATSSDLTLQLVNITKCKLSSIFSGRKEDLLNEDRLLLAQHNSLLVFHTGTTLGNKSVKYKRARCLSSPRMSD